MKKQILFIAMLFSCLSYNAQAQVGISVNINTQPVWGPVGYDRADYYYFPDIQTYYSVSRHEYTYFDGGRWISTPALPPRYHDYDLYHGYKVVINEPNPWVHDGRYSKLYAQYRGRHDQAVIRDSHDKRYYSNPGHPEYKNQNHHEGPRDDHHDNGDHREEGHR